MDIAYTSKDIDYLLSPRAIRERTKLIFELAKSGKTHFKLHLDKLNDVSDYVLEVIHNNYPSLNIPFHSRHGHLNAGGIPRIAELEKVLSYAAPRAVAKAKIDLVVVSVLLDAGAGDNWKMVETSSGKTFARSEGLAVSSFHLFMSGRCSGDPKNHYQADALGLQKLRAQDINEFFQVTNANPLIGVEGRVHLLNELGRVIEQHPMVFKTGRVGDLLDVLIEQDGEQIQAVHVLDFVLKYLGDIWPSRICLGDQSLGDVWSYSGFGKPGTTDCLVPFHKLSQWLTYSLLVPMVEMGLQIRGVDELTGLAEYRNGGLFVDAGVITLRNSVNLQKKHAPESDLVIEWRALTIALLDLVGEEIQKKLKMTKEQLPLAKVLEGGTWHAGRKIAKEKRPGGEPPLNILSDGTVF